MHRHAVGGERARYGAEIVVTLSRQLVADYGRGFEEKNLRRMVQFAMEDPALLLYHNEPIYRDGQRVGLVTSANYGHTLGAAIGMGYVSNEAGVDAEFIKSGKFEIAIAGVRHAAKASLRPMVDPSGARMKA